MQPDSLPRIAPHNRGAAAVWNAGGASYNDISFAISDALAHAAQRLNPKPGTHILDVATGTGWTARNVARAGARVDAVDIASELLAAAEVLSAHVEPRIAYRLGDAEDLPYSDATFDGVISTFGVMFAEKAGRAARELGRVCRQGGRLVLTTWAEDGAVARFFGVLAGHDHRPTQRYSPLQTWGRPERLVDLLAKDWELTFEPGVNHAYHDDADDIWSWYLKGFGPLRSLAERLGPTGCHALKSDVDAYHSHYVTAAGLHIQREYLVTIGRRRG